MALDRGFEPLDEVNLVEEALIWRGIQALGDLVEVAAEIAQLGRGLDDGFELPIAELRFASEVRTYEGSNPSTWRHGCRAGALHNCVKL